MWRENESYYLALDGKKSKEIFDLIRFSVLDF